ncbi:MAG: hypothetical protein LBF72_00980 [Holosporales bacterium]|jgi:hypothetical protein|nr:hypothetical protein [Holosporales bacterium]
MSTSLKVFFSSVAILGGFSAFASEFDAGAVAPKEKTTAPDWEKQIVALVKKPIPCNSLGDVLKALADPNVLIEVSGQDGERNPGLEAALYNYHEAVERGEDTSWFNSGCLSNCTVKAIEVSEVNVRSEEELGAFGDNLVGDCVSLSYKGDPATFWLSSHDV